MRVKLDAKKQSGNVLFLILIAVALFGVLAYSVTQSMRGGDAQAVDTDRMSNSALIQYSVGIRSNVMRMTFDGRQKENLEFNAPADFANCSTGFFNCVFHPEGGGAAYQLLMPDSMTNATPNEWIFNGENEINLLGSSTTGDSVSPLTADIISFMPGITQRFCQSINTTIGIDLIPEETGIIFTSNSSMVNPNGFTPTQITGGGATIGSPAGVNVEVLDGQLYGCFEQNGQYVYFHSIVEQ